MLVTSIFFIFHIVFHPIGARNHHFSNIYFVVCKCFQFGPVYNLPFGKVLRKSFDCFVGRIKVLNHRANIFILEFLSHAFQEILAKAVSNYMNVCIFLMESVLYIAPPGGCEFETRLRRTFFPAYFHPC